MASFLIRLSALLLSASLFALAYHEPSAKAEGYLGGCFFLGLFVAAYFERKYIYLCLGGLFLFAPCFGFVTGTVFGFGRSAFNKSLAVDPAGYWATMILWSFTAIGLIAYGAYKAFGKRDSR